MDERKNWGELLEFLHSNSSRTKTTRGNISFHFAATIVYCSSPKTVTRKAAVMVETNGWQAGRITLLDARDFPTEKFHQDFRPKYQEMRYDRLAGTLVITGTSEKMGDYDVTITPLAPLEGNCGAR